MADTGMAMGTPIVGRAAQLAELSAVAGLHTHSNERLKQRVYEAAPPLVVVYGGVSTGKSLCMHHALHAAADDFALVDCTGVMTTREFYREILGQLQSHRRRRRRATAGAFEAHDPAAEHDEDAPLLDDGDVVTITGAPAEAATVAADAAANGKRAKRTASRKATRRGGDGDGHSSSDSEAASDLEEKTDSGRGRGEDVTDRIRAANGSTRAAANGASGVEEENGEEAPQATEAFGSLNFLSFVKALSAFMDGVVQSESSRGGKPTVFVTLDHVETLLDRGLDKLVTCLLAVNDQLDYTHVFDAAGTPWRLCVVLVARAVSLDLDLFLHGAHPAFIHFPVYTKEEVAAIVTHNLLEAASRQSPELPDSGERAAWLRKWLVGVYDLLPHIHNDWLEFQHVVVQMLPSLHEFFDLVATDRHYELPLLASQAPLPTTTTMTESQDAIGDAHGKNRPWRQLQTASRAKIATLEKTRRRHLFGYDTIGGGGGGGGPPSSLVSSSGAAFAPITSGDPVSFIASSKLSRSCLLLLVASYLASFTPHEADIHFVSSSGGLKRKRRVHKASGESGGSNGTPGGKKSPSSAAARKAMNQQLVGPKIFELPRLLAIYSNLHLESDATMENATDDDEDTRYRHGGGEDAAEAGPLWAPGHDRPDDRSTRTRADIFTHLSLLVRLRLLQRASPPSDLDQPQFRCTADTRLVEEIARRLQFPLDSYLNTRG